MPKKVKKASAAEASVKGTRKQPTTDPMQKATKAGRKRAADGHEGERDAEPTDRPQCSGTKPNGQRCRRPPVRGGERCQKHGGVAQRTNAQKRADLNAAISGSEKVTCTATKRNGDRCSNPPVRGTTCCRMHGAGAPQVKAKANQRLIEMVIPAMRELRRVLDSKTASDGDKLKAINMVLNRTGYNERREIDLGLRTPTPFDDLVTSSVVILRGEDNIIDPGDEHQALPPGGGGEMTDEELEAFLEHRNRRREREAQSHIDNRGHDVVRGSVADDGLTSDAHLFGFPKSRERRYAESGGSENSEGTRPGEDPWSDYERLVRERVEDRKR